MIKPVEYKCLIKPDKVEGQTSGGLYLPDSARDKQQFSVDRGVLTSVGDGFFSNLPGPTPKVGEKVIFNRYAGSLIKCDGEDYRLINDKDICAILEE